MKPAGLAPESAAVSSKTALSHQMDPPEGEQPEAKGAESPEGLPGNQRVPSQLSKASDKTQYSGPGEEGSSGPAKTQEERQREEGFNGAKFWGAIERGDRDEAERMLLKEFELEEDVAGRIVDSLSGTGITKLREGLLYSIDAEQNSLMEAILDMMKERGLSENTPIGNTTHGFAPHITPLMLACFKNNFETVSILLNRGHRINFPHRSVCGCDKCLEERTLGETVETAHFRIDCFRAVSSSAFIWLGTHDPFLLTFEVSRELEKCADEDGSHAMQYDVVRNKLRQFSAKLTKLLRSEEDVRLVLSRPEGVRVSNQDFTLPRLRLALNNHMKEFLYDFSVQTELDRTWVGSWSDWKMTPPWRNGIRWVNHTILFPITSILFVLSNRKIMRSYFNPCARFISYTCAFLLFLLFLLILPDFQKGDVRGLSQSFVENFMLCYVWSYVFGCIFWDSNYLWKQGGFRYFRLWWNWFNVTLYAFYIISFAYWIRAVVVTADDEAAIIERRHWPWWDPSLVAEAMFSLGTILAFWKFFYFLQMVKFFGPHVISIGRCIKQIIIYFVVMAWVMFSYSIGLSYMYQNYPYPDADTFDTNNDDQFITIGRAFRRLYWSFYGKLPPELMDAPLQDVGMDNTTTSHWITRGIGESIAVGHCIVLIIILINLMVAMMVNSAAEILENEDLEWKFVRSTILAEFMEEENSLPPPLNFVYWVYSWLPFVMSGRCRFKCWPEGFYLEPEYDKRELALYQQLMISLFRRYIGHTDRTYTDAAHIADNEEDPPSKGLDFVKEYHELEKIKKTPAVFKDKAPGDHGFQGFAKKRAKAKARAKGQVQVPVIKVEQS